MIKLVRQPLTEELLEKTNARAVQLEGCLERNEDPPESLLNAYREPKLKQHLVKEAHGKCAYCESKISHVYFGDVEHFRPKAHFPAMRLNVANLVLSCAICNSTKGDFWNDNIPFLDPYVDDPDVELLALGFIIAHRPGRNRARLTVSKLNLNRLALVERRKERIELLQSLADQYVQTPDGPIKDILRNELLQHAANSGEYAFIVRTYLKAACDFQYSQSD